MFTQLPLAVHLPDDETFESFVVGQNEQLVGHLQSVLKGVNGTEVPLTYISGDSGVGKSHLLFAMCQGGHVLKKSSLYISLKQKDELSVTLLDGLEHYQLLCIDDIQLIEQDISWQVALFDLINRVKEAGQGHLLLTANAGPKSLTLALADLQSRLAWGLSYQLHELNEAGKLQALKNRARRRGLQMTTEVAQFLLSHLQRDMPALMSVLDTLDKSSLQQQRKLTIPFVKQVLGL
jgi:DnaA family protein